MLQSCIVIFDFHAQKDFWLRSLPHSFLLNE